MDFTTLEFHLVHFSCPSCPVKVHPVHSNTCIFSYLFLCISLLASSFTVPCITVFAKPEDLEMWPNQHSFCFLAIARGSLYSPISAWIFLRTSSHRRRKRGGGGGGGGGAGGGAGPPIILEGGQHTLWPPQ